MHLGEPVVRVDGTTATVVAIHTVPGAASMWDLTVSTVHTFAVGAGAYVVHNCGQVPYDSGGLASKVAEFRKGQKTARGLYKGNYAAALLDDGSTIFGKSGKGLHAEEDLLNQAGKRGIEALYSEREPCSWKCAGKLAEKGVKNITWTWAWNGLDHDAVSAAMETFFRGRY